MRARRHGALQAAVLCLLAVGLPLPAGCQAKKKDTPEAAEQSTSRANKAKEEAREEPSQNSSSKVPGFKVNGEKIASVQLAAETELLSIAGLPPIDDWKLLIVRNLQGREFRATKPSLLTGERTMKIVRRDDASYEFVVMQKSGADEIVRHRMPQVKVIEVHRQGYTPPSVPTTTKEESVLAIKANGETRQLNAQALEAVKRSSEPGGEKKRDTWLLLDIVGKPGRTPGRSLLMRGLNNTELLLKTDLLNASSERHFIKRNRRGHFHYRSWSGGESPAQTGGLRNLLSIEVLSLPPKKPH